MINSIGIVADRQNIARWKKIKNYHVCGNWSCEDFEKFSLATKNLGYIKLDVFGEQENGGPGEQWKEGNGWR